MISVFTLERLIVSKKLDKNQRQACCRHIINLNCYYYSNIIQKKNNNYSANVSNFVIQIRKTPWPVFEVGRKLPSRSHWPISFSRYGRGMVCKQRFLTIISGDPHKSFLFRQKISENWYFYDADKSLQVHKIER